MDELFLPAASVILDFNLPTIPVSFSVMAFIVKLGIILLLVSSTYLLFSASCASNSFLDVTFFALSSPTPDPVAAAFLN